MSSPIKDSSPFYAATLKLPIVVIGVGNEYRSDDAVGLFVATKLKEMHLPDEVSIKRSEKGDALIETWKEAGTVILVDAVSSRAEPGSVYRFNAREEKIPRNLFSHCSTHTLGIKDSIELAEALSQLPPRLIVYGIEGKNFETGNGLSPEVEEAAHEVVKAITQEIKWDNIEE
jgi:hydrogenase maturation protease